MKSITTKDINALVEHLQNITGEDIAISLDGAGIMVRRDGTFCFICDTSEELAAWLRGAINFAK